MNDIIDFAIVTALQVEREAVLEQMDAYEVVQAENDPQTYFRGHVTLPAANERYEVVVIMLMGMGNNEAAIATTRLIERWHPASVIMLGIGAGVPGEVNLGDVIVADFIYYYELAKRTVEGEQRRGQQFPCDRLLFERARAHRSDAWYRSIDLPRPDGQTLDVAPPRVCFGPFASGE
jgi:nucleoside phosphorylase